MEAVADWSHEAVLDAEPVSARLARDFVGRHLEEHHLPHLVDNVCLVASELATNAVIHARTSFTVTISCSSGSLLLAVRDASASVPVRATPQVMDTSGRGLFLVELLSRECGIRGDADGSKSVWASFSTEPW